MFPIFRPYQVSEKHKRSRDAIFHHFEDTREAVPLYSTSSDAGILKLLRSLGTSCDLRQHLKAAAQFQYLTEYAYKDDKQSTVIQDEIRKILVRRSKTLLNFQRDAQRKNKNLESETLLEALDIFAHRKDDLELKSLLEARIIETKSAESLQSARSPMRPHYTKILRSDCLGIKKKN